MGDRVGVPVVTDPHAAATAVHQGAGMFLSIDELRQIAEPFAVEHGKPRDRFGASLLRN